MEIEDTRYGNPDDAEAPEWGRLVTSKPRAPRPPELR
jgi:hypothetical protein